MQPTQTPARAKQSGVGIKYANPRDLSSYPSLGLKKSDAATSAAATLGWTSQRTSESSKPSNPSAPAAASTAALLAHDNRMRSNSELSDKPTTSMKAATLASKSFTTASSRREQPANLAAMSSSAATQAFRASPRLSPRDSQFSSAGRRGPTLAANGTMSTLSTRPRAQSSPLSRDSALDQRSAALSAATLAHRPSIRSQHIAPESGATPYTTLPRSMFTATPPLKIEAEDQKKNDELHASAVAMARKMYTQQQTVIDATKKAHGIEPSRTPAQPIPSLQETAYKLAQERVAKLNNGDRQSREHHEYYGASSPIQRCFSTRSLLRPRASSDSDAMYHHRQSRHIQQQMPLFNSKLNEVDEQKQDADRQALLAIAQKNVKAQLADIDSKIQTNTSRVRSVSNEWQIKAQAAARLKSEERTSASHPDKVDIGGGKFLNMKDVEAIASKRMEPVLAEISRKAGEERMRLAQLQAEQEAKKQEAEEKKAKEREIKEANRQQKEREKQAERGRKEKEKQEERERREIGKREERERREAQKQEERQRKEEERAKKEEEKATKAEFKRQAKEEKRRNRELVAAAKATEKLRRQHEEQQTHQPADHNNHGAESDIDSDGSSLLSSRPSTPMSTGSHHQTPNEDLIASPTSPRVKVKTWFKHRFSRSRAESSAIEEKDRAKSRPSTNDSSFVGGAALNRSSNSLPSERESRTREVTVAGRKSESQFPQFLGEGQSEVPIARSVSLLTDEDENEDEEFVLAPRSRGGSSGSSLERAQELMPTPRMPGGKAPGAFGSETITGAGSLLRDSRFREVID